MEDRLQRWKGLLISCDLKDKCGEEIVCRYISVVTDRAFFLIFFFPYVMLYKNSLCIYRLCSGFLFLSCVVMEEFGFLQQGPASYSIVAAVVYTVFLV